MKNQKKTKNCVNKCGKLKQTKRKTKENHHEKYIINTNLILIIGALALSGCSTIPLDTRSYDELKARDSRMYRGIVEHIAPDDVFSQALHQTNEVDVFALSWYNKSRSPSDKILYPKFVFTKYQALLGDLACLLIKTFI